MHYHVLFCIYNWNYCGTFVVPKFLLPLETLDFTGVYLLVDFKVGNRSTSLYFYFLVKRILIEFLKVIVALLFKGLLLEFLVLVHANHKYLLTILTSFLSLSKNI